MWAPSTSASVIVPTCGNEHWRGSKTCYSWRNEFLHWLGLIHTSLFQRSKITSNWQNGLEFGYVLLPEPPAGSHFDNEKFIHFSIIWWTVCQLPGRLEISRPDSLTCHFAGRLAAIRALEAKSLFHLLSNGARISKRKRLISFTEERRLVILTARVSKLGLSLTFQIVGLDLDRDDGSQPFTNIIPSQIIIFSLRILFWRA